MPRTSPFPNTPNAATNRSISFPFTLLRTLLHHPKRYLPSFLHFPNSFRKTPGVGTPQLQKGAPLRRGHHRYEISIRSSHQPLFLSLRLRPSMPPALR
jgi:hypothetical protein